VPNGTVVQGRRRRQDVRRMEGARRGFCPWPAERIFGATAPS
jgi:hypothetical protein